MDYEYQNIARRHNFILQDKVFNKLNNLWGNLCATRNYENGYVQKNYETNLIFLRYS